MSARKKVLIAAANNAELPIIKHLKSEGYVVVTLSNREFDIAHEQSDISVIADYSDPNCVKKTFIEHKCHYLVPGSNDFSMLSCTEVAEELKLPGFDSLTSSKGIHYKSELRQLQQRLGLTHPSFLIIGKDHDLSIPPDRLKKFPVIVKPIDMGGGKGISLCNSMSELEYAVKKVRYTSKKEEIVIEEFIPGTHHGISTIIKDKKVIFYCHDDEYYWENKFLVGGTSFPSSMSEGILKQAVGDIEKIAADLDLVDGLLHAQLINLGHTCMIGEVTRRTPGDSYLLFGDRVSSYNYISNFLAPFLGKKVKSNNSKLNSDCFISRVCLHPRKNGVINEIDLNLFERFIEEKIIWMKPGDFIGDYKNEKVGIVFFKFKDFNEMKRVIASFSHAEVVIMED